MNIIVTGSNGFIGKAIVERTKNDNHNVYEWTRQGVFHNCVFVNSWHLEDPVDVTNALESLKPDIVFHCAGSANVNYSVNNPYDDMVSNYVTTHNLLFAINKLHLNTSFVLFSSAAVYGNPTSLPMPESEPMNPLSPYAVHKLAAEELCIFMNKNHNINIKILRPFSVYGPGLKKQIFWDMYNKIEKESQLSLLGTGDESRDYIYIDDVVEATMKIAYAETDELVYNVGNGKEITIREAARCFAEIMHFPADKILFTGNRRSGDPINWCADITRLKKIGYKQLVSFKDGLENYINWAKKESQVF